MQIQVRTVCKRDRRLDCILDRQGGQEASVCYLERVPIGQELGDHSLGQDPGAAPGRKVARQ